MLPDRKRARLPAPATGIAVVVALAGPPMFVVVSDWLFGESPRLAVQIVLQLLFCTFAAFIAWVVLSLERLPLTSIGLRRPTWSTLVSAGLLCAIVSFALPLVTGPLLQVLRTAGVQAGVAELAMLPLWFRLIVGVTGAIVEEILYRGYAADRLATLTGRAWLGGAISAVAFATAHIPEWGVGFALGADLPFGVLMTAFFLWKRDLAANIFAHAGGLTVAMLTISP